MNRPYEYVIDPAVFWLRMDAVDLNSKELAGRCGVTPSYMSQVTGGKCSPGRDLRTDMAAALGVIEEVLFMRIPKARQRQPGDLQSLVLWRRKHAKRPRRVRSNTRERPRARRRLPPGRAYPAVPRAAG